MSDLFDDWINDPSDRTLSEFIEERERVVALNVALKPMTPEQLHRRHMMQAHLMQQIQPPNLFGGLGQTQPAQRGGGFLGGLMGGLF